MISIFKTSLHSMLLIYMLAAGVHACSSLQPAESADQLDSMQECFLYCLQNKQKLTLQQAKEQIEPIFYSLYVFPIPTILPPERWFHNLNNFLTGYHSSSLQPRESKFINFLNLITTLSHLFTMQQCGPHTQGVVYPLDAKLSPLILDLQKKNFNHHEKTHLFEQITNTMALACFQSFLQHYNLPTLPDTLTATQAYHHFVLCSTHYAHQLSTHSPFYPLVKYCTSSNINQGHTHVALNFKKARPATSSTLYCHLQNTILAHAEFLTPRLLLTFLPNLPNTQKLSVSTTPALLYFCTKVCETGCSNQQISKTPKALKDKESSLTDSLSHHYDLLTEVGESIVKKFTANAGAASADTRYAFCDLIFAYLITQEIKKQNPQHLRYLNFLEGYYIHASACPLWLTLNVLCAQLLGTLSETLSWKEETVLGYTKSHHNITSLHKTLLDQAAQHLPHTILTSTLILNPSWRKPSIGYAIQLFRYKIWDQIQSDQKELNTPLARPIPSHKGISLIHNPIAFCIYFFAQSIEHASFDSARHIIEVFLSPYNFEAVKAENSFTWLIDNLEARVATKHHTLSDSIFAFLAHGCSLTLDIKCRFPERMQKWKDAIREFPLFGANGTSLITRYLSALKCLSLNPSEHISIDDSLHTLQQEPYQSHLTLFYQRLISTPTCIKNFSKECCTETLATLRVVHLISQSSPLVAPQLRQYINSRPQELLLSFPSQLKAREQEEIHLLTKDPNLEEVMDCQTHNLDTRNTSEKSDLAESMDCQKLNLDNNYIAEQSNLDEGIGDQTQTLAESMDYQTRSLDNNDIAEQSNLDEGIGDQTQTLAVRSLTAGSDLELEEDLCTKTIVAHALLGLYDSTHQHTPPLAHLATHEHKPIPTPLDIVPEASKITTRMATCAKRTLSPTDPPDVRYRPYRVIK